MYTYTEEKYLKAIFKVIEKENKSASTNSLAKHLKTTAASVTDMLKKLSEKDLINYEKYKGVTLTPEGNKVAISLIRKHRLWEVFLVEKLRFSWHQVHEIAEELEHINSTELILRLDAFLNYPRFDPHGDSIPNAEGRFTIRSQTPLSELIIGKTGILVGVKEDTTPFLKYLDECKIKLGCQLTVVEKVEFDRSQKVEIDGMPHITLSETVCQSLLVRSI